MIARFLRIAAVGYVLSTTTTHMIGIAQADEINGDGPFQLGMSRTTLRRSMFTTKDWSEDHCGDECVIEVMTYDVGGIRSLARAVFDHDHLKAVNFNFHSGDWMPINRQACDSKFKAVAENWRLKWGPPEEKSEHPTGAKTDNIIVAVWRSNHRIAWVREEATASSCAGVDAIIFDGDEEELSSFQQWMKSASRKRDKNE
jgi:hypothetical protein